MFDLSNFARWASQQHSLRVLQIRLEGAQPLRAHGTVDGAVVAGKRYGHDGRGAVPGSNASLVLEFNLHLRPFGLPRRESICLLW